MVFSNILGVIYDSFPFLHPQYHSSSFPKVLPLICPIFPSLHQCLIITLFRAPIVPHLDMVPFFFLISVFASGYVPQSKDLETKSPKEREHKSDIFLLGLGYITKYNIFLSFFHSFIHSFIYSLSSIHLPEIS